jgi:tetratricopeptide (TPR) repeat protein
MKNKFRVKLKSGRVIGPFGAQQIGELYTKGHIDGAEKCQSYPEGDWNEFKSFTELTEAILTAITNDESTGTIDYATKIDTIARLGLVKKVRDNKELKNINKNSDKGTAFNEFQFEKKAKTGSVDYAELERKHQQRSEIQDIEDNNDSADSDDSEKDESEFSFKGLVENDEFEAAPDQDSSIEKTRLIRIPIGENAIEKTVVLQKNIIAKLKEDTKSLIVNREEEDEAEEHNVISTGDATQFININDLVPIAKDEVREIEKEIELKIAEVDREKVKEEQAIIKRKEERIARREMVTKKGMKPIVAIAFFVIVWFVVTDDEKVARPLPARIKITFPITESYEDTEKAKSFYLTGIETYSKESFLAKTIAAKYFRSSLSNKFKKNKSLGWLIITYSEIYENALNKAKAASVIHKLLKIARSKILSDVNVAIGAAVFYSSYGKHKTAVNVIENFLRVGKPSLKILSTYLNVLIAEGELIKARKVYEKLLKLPKKSISTTIALLNFLEQDEKISEANILVKQALKKNKNSLSLLLRSAKYEFEIGNYKNFKKRLNLIEQLNSGSSPIYYAKYLEFKGMLSAANKKLKNAAKYFKTALEINESDELRSKLATLSLGGSETVEALILQSKVISKMKYAKQAIREKNWEKSFKYAIEAADMLPSYIPAQLLLAKIQTRRGFYESAIKTLVLLKKENPVNGNVNFSLITTYVESLKLEEASRLINMISQTKLRRTAGYASSLGRFYAKKKNNLLARKWLKESIKRFPLNDADYYLLAKIYLKDRKYDNALEMLNEAIALDPKMVEYHSTYAEILYERSDVDHALGYLRDILEDNKESPKILGDIAIYYYRSGQIKRFEDYMKKVEALNTKDQSFYKFLIKAAKLDERSQDVIKYSRELIKINPGDLEARMILGEYLLSEKQLPVAIEAFEAITSRLDGFPRANYYLAKIFISMGDLDQGLKFAEKEVFKNKTLEYGYFIRGEAYKAKKNYQSAISNYEKAISINGKSVDSLMALGWIKHRQNFYEEARELYLRAKSSDESNAEVYKRLGYVYKSTGNSGLAVESFQTYLDGYPGAPDRIRIEQEIKQLR